MKYRDKQNLKFIKKKISEESLPTPEALSEENISRLLYSQAEQQPIKASPPRHIAVKSIISLAACLVIVISALSINGFMGKNDIAKSYVRTNSSYTELKKKIDKIKLADEQSAVVYEAELEIFDQYSGSNSMSASKDEATNGSSAHSETYTQVEGVDEADIIKNDGKYIYVTGHSNTFINIYKADGEKTELVSTIEINGINYINDMYLYNNKLVVNCAYSYAASSEEYSYSYYYYTGKTSTHIYDLSDKANPELLTTLIQDGDYISSRIIDNQLYVITNKYIEDNPKELEDYVPTLSYNNEKAQLIPAEDICYIDEPEVASYVVVSSYNLDDGTQYTDSKAVLGAGTNIYCSQNNLYVANDSYDFGYGRILDGSHYTNILKFSLNNGKIEFEAEGKVKGYTNNQYSFDEKDGYLRVATTYTGKNYVEANALFVLDENLEKVGSVTGFAKNESIEAVKFIGDMAYVITFEQTDPLFVIDLSDPTKPEIKGEVEITGFSTMLHPVDENTLLGIGYASSSLPDGGWVDGIKLALFDISDPEKPAVLDSEVIKDCYSEAQFNPKAFMVNDDMGYYAIPFEAYYSENNSSGAIAFEVIGNQIEITNKYEFQSDEYFDNPYFVHRCTYIDEYLYIIGSDYIDNFTIQAFKHSK